MSVSSDAPGSTRSGRVRRRVPTRPADTQPDAFTAPQPVPHEALARRASKRSPVCLLGAPPGTVSCRVKFPATTQPRSRLMEYRIQDPWWLGVVAASDRDVRPIKRTASSAYPGPALVVDVMASTLSASARRR